MSQVPHSNCEPYYNSKEPYYKPWGKRDGADLVTRKKRRCRFCDRKKRVRRGVPVFQLPKTNANCSGQRLGQAQGMHYTLRIVRGRPGRFRLDYIFKTCQECCSELRCLGTSSEFFLGCPRSHTVTVSRTITVRNLTISREARETVQIW